MARAPSDIDTPRGRAFANGEATYFGKACLRGHIGMRYTNNAVCCSCHQTLFKKKVRATDSSNFKIPHHMASVFAWAQSGKQIEERKPWK